MSRLVAGVEVAGGFVGEQHGRVIDDRPGDGHALLLTAGELVRHTPAFALQAHEFERLRDERADEFGRLAEHLKREGDILGDGLVG
jgi:hypothetical protein